MLIFEDYSVMYKDLSLSKEDFTRKYSGALTEICNNATLYPIITYCILDRIEHTLLDKITSDICLAAMGGLINRYPNLFHDNGFSAHSYWASITNHPAIKDDYMLQLALNDLDMFNIVPLQPGTQPPVYTPNSILNFHQQMELKQEFIEIEKGEPVYMSNIATKYFYILENHINATSAYIFGNVFPEETDEPAWITHEAMQEKFDKLSNKRILVAPILTMCLNFLYSIDSFKCASFYDEFFMNILNDPDLKTNFYSLGLHISLKS